MTQVKAERLRDGRCPARTRRNIMFCSCSINGVCKHGFNAIDRKGQCFRKSKANAAVEARRNAVASDGLLADESKGETR